MARRPSSARGAPIRENIEVLTFAVVMALALKPFALEPYQIPTGSMQPTLLGTALVDPETQRPAGGVHDRVLVDKVSFLLRDPQRWEVVVFRYPLATLNNYVKRCVGLPGEELQIRYGDIWTRPLGSDEDFRIQRKPRELQETLWRRVHPRPGQEAAVWTGWELRGGARREAGGRVRLEGHGEVERKQIRDRYTDGYPDEIALMVRSQAPPVAYVSDLRLAFTARSGAAPGPLEVDMKLAAYDLRLSLDPTGGTHRLDLPDGTVETFGLKVPAEAEIAFDLAFWDHHVEVRIETPEDSWELARDLLLEARGSKLNHVRILTPGDRGGWILEPPGIWRDIHYRTPQREQGPESLPVAIEEGHYFMLGDNTQHSQDSREWKARVLELREPVKGAAILRGDDFRGGSDPFYDNPRWSDPARSPEGESWMTFRDEHGELYQFPVTNILRDNVEYAPLVPREYILGKVLAVFLPVQPFAPLNRIGFVR